MSLICEWGVALKGRPKFRLSLARPCEAVAEPKAKVARRGKAFEFWQSVMTSKIWISDTNLLSRHQLQRLEESAKGRRKKSQSQRHCKNQTFDSTLHQSLLAEPRENNSLYWAKMYKYIVPWFGQRGDKNNARKGEPKQKPTGLLHDYKLRPPAAKEINISKQSRRIYWQRLTASPSRQLGPIPARLTWFCRRVFWTPADCKWYPWQYSFKLHDRVSHNFRKVLTNVTLQFWLQVWINLTQQGGR